MIKLTLLFITLFAHPFLPKKEVTINWTESTSLVWANFEAKPNKWSKSAAITVSGFNAEYIVEKNILKITSSAFFYPQKSWVKKEVKNEDGLKHEQVHFDITELYVRKFRQIIQQEIFKKNNIKVRFNKIYTQQNALLNKYQNLYDLETEHHLNKANQALWNKKIAKELVELSNYNNNKLVVTIK